MVDHRRQRRRLARPRGPHHEDEAALRHDEILVDLRHAELFQSRHLRTDVPQHHGRIATLVEHVDAKPSQSGFGYRKIYFQLLVEVLELLLAHHSQRRLPHRLRAQNLLVDRKYLALDLDLDRGVTGKKKVRGSALHHELEERPGVEHECRFGGRHQKTWPSSSSTICSAAETPWTSLLSRLLSSLTFNRSSFLESALRNASS